MIRKKEHLKAFTFMSVGALGYGSMEVIARGFTHISMGLLGGLCFCFIAFTGNLRRQGRLTLLEQLLTATFFITTSELICGLITNLLLGLNVWDYSEVPLNYKGQICLPFSVLWFCISGFAIAVDGWIRRNIFHENTQRTTAEIKSPVLTHD